MRVHPVRRSRIYEAIVEQLQDLILRGEVTGGDRLPSERDLADRFDGSRVSVRQALAVLQAMGLIQIRSGGGVFVRERSAGVSSPAAAISADQGVPEAQMEVRLLVEPRTAALAALRCSPADIRRMGDAIADQRRGIATSDLGITGDVRFHLAVAGAAGNPILLQMMESVMSALMPSRAASARVVGGPLKAVQEHQVILRAIERRDPRAAERAMRSHLFSVERHALGLAPNREKRLATGTVRRKRR